MSQIKAPIPHVAHLKVLMDLYLSLHGLKQKRASLSRTDFKIEAVRFLKADGIIRELVVKKAAKISLNLFNKLDGFPYQKEDDPKKWEGIKPEVLNLIAQKVIEHYALTNMYGTFDTSHSGIPYWHYFTESIIRIPTYLIGFKNRYYRNLDEWERKSVDMFCERIVNEIAVEHSNIVNFCLYFWEVKSKQVLIACAQIDFEAKVAIIKYFKPKELRWPDSVQRTDIGEGRFTILNNTLHLTLLDEHPEHTHIRTYVCVAAHATNLQNSLFMKGTYTTSVDRGQTPVQGMIALERQQNYAITLEVLKGQRPANARILFDTIEKRTDLTEKAIDSITDFDSSDIYNIVEKIQGAYVFGLLSSKQNYGNKLTLTRGICFITIDGMVLTKIHNDRDVRGYVNNDFYHNEETFVISNFYTPGLRFKHHYTLSTVVDDDEINTVLGLEGVYSGVYNGKPRAGKIVYAKVPQFESWQAMYNADINYQKIDLGATDIYRFVKSKPITELWDKWDFIYQRLIGDSYLMRPQPKKGK
jgi:hypothetical protein